MANLTPATNVQVAAVAAFLSAGIEHLCSAYGMTLPTDMADALPAVVAIAVAHLWDLWQGTNK